MIGLPTGFRRTISHFSFAFRKDVFVKVEQLLSGALVCPGSRTVCNLLRCTGLKDERNFPKYHRFLSRDKWSAFRLSGVLFGLLVNAFVPKGVPIVLGMDDTIERRWGRKTGKRGIYRDPVRSSKSHFVKCSGLRWLSVMLLCELPWLERGICWALPFLTVLCPSERYYLSRDRQPKKLTIFARQAIIWLGRQKSALQRKVYLTGDGSFATMELFMQASGADIGLIARMKLNSRMYAPPVQDRPKGKRGPIPPVGDRLMSMEERLADKGTCWQKVTFSHWYGNRDKEMLLTWGVAIWRKDNSRLVKVKWALIKDPDGKLDPVLLACTDWQVDAREMVGFFVRRWRVEVTFAETRRHLGVETQRQWSDLAIERTTPCLMALFSLTCLFAHQLQKARPIVPNTTAWYKKQGVTFSDVLTKVRLALLQQENLFTRPEKEHINSSANKIRDLCFMITQAAA